jgi:hypothetical protein
LGVGQEEDIVHNSHLGVAQTIMAILTFNPQWVLIKILNHLENLFLSRRPKDQLAPTSHQTRDRIGTSDYSVRKWLYIYILYLLLTFSFAMEFNEVHQMDVYDEQLYGQLQHFGRDIVARNVLNVDIYPNEIYSEVGWGNPPTELENNVNV